MSAFQPHRLSRFLQHFFSNHLLFHRGASAYVGLMNSNVLHSHPFQLTKPLHPADLRSSIPPSGQKGSRDIATCPHSTMFLSFRTLISICYYNHVFDVCLSQWTANSTRAGSGLFLTIVTSLTLRRQNGDQLVIEKCRLWGQTTQFQIPALPSMYLTLSNLFHLMPQFTNL